MTNEKMLQMLKSIRIEEKTIDISAYLALKTQLEEDIRKDVAKKQGVKTNDLQIIKRVIKQTKGNQQLEPFCNGYHTFYMRDKIYKGFLSNEYILASNNDFGYQKCNKDFPMERYFTIDKFRNTQIEIDMIDLKTFAKTHKKKKYEKVDPYIINVDNAKIGFNPTYLIDVLDFCETNIISVTNGVSGAYCCSEDMDKIAMVLPIRLTE